jgi:basic amino acid/polyamine antiporter, APA family
MGLGSIVGTGLFVSLGIAAGVAGSGILVALVLAALLALCNGLSSAQLAAAHPVSGGTYAYGYRFLSPAFGFAAGTMFLLAKSASAATAALGLRRVPPRCRRARRRPGTEGGRCGCGRDRADSSHGPGHSPIQPGQHGRRGGDSGRVRGIPGGRGGARGRVDPGASTAPEAWGTPSSRRPRPVWGAGWETGWASGGDGLLHATALLFVAYTGYGRIATLGEEVRDPARTIPRAIWLTLGTVALLYFGVAAVALLTLGAEAFARETTETAAPLQAVAREWRCPGSLPPWRWRR